MVTKAEAIHTHSQEMADIRNTWKLTEPQAKDEFLAMLETDDAISLRRTLTTAPDVWLFFIQQCTAAALRQSGINNWEEEQ